MNNQAGRSDEQRVKETSNETFYERLDRIERENRIARLFRNRPENLHDYQGCANDAASRLPKAEAAPEAVKIDWQAVYSGEKARDANMEVTRLTCKKCGGLQEGCTCPEPAAPPVEEGEVTAQTFEEWWQQNGPGDENISFRDIQWALTLMKNMCELAWNAAKASSPVVAGGESEKEHWWFAEIRPIINAIGEISVQEAMDAVEKMLKEPR